MKKVKFVVLAVLAMFVLVGCGEPQDRVSGVQWMKDGQVAVVSFYPANGDRQTYKIRCGQTSVKTPFSYEWEDDCDLGTEVDGIVRDWDNPEDERFENDRSQYRYDEDGEEEGFDGTDFVIGAVAGSMIGSLTKKKKKTSTYKQSSTVRKTPVRKTSTSRKSTKR